MTPAAITTPALSSVESTRLRRLSLLLGLSFFATTFAVDQTLILPFRYLLKDHLHLPPQAMAGFFALAGMAWYFKPLAGILSDTFPLFGTRRRSYLLLSACGAGLFWLLLAIVPRKYGPLLWMDILVNAMIVLASSVTGGLLVEQGQASGATGRLSSLRNVTYTGAGLVASPVGGYLAGHAFGWTCGLAAACFFLLVPAVLLLLHEPQQPRTDASARLAAWNGLKTQWMTLRRTRAMWLAALFQFCFYIAPGFSTPLFYYQTNINHFSSVFIGWLGVASGGVGVLGSLAYVALCRRYSMRTLLIGMIVFGAIAPLGYLHYHTHTDAWIVESIYGLADGLASVVIFDMAARAAPKGSEALAYALLMSADNIARQLSDVVGSRMNGIWHVSFVHLVPINAVTTLLVLALIPLLPKSLLAGRDGAAAADTRAASGVSSPTDHAPQPPL